MPKTDYVSDLDGEQIEAALEAIHDVVTPSNNGKVLCIVGGKIAAKSASEWGGGGYPEPTGTIPIASNGTVNVKDYASAEVNVPNSYSAADEGKVVKNGALVAQTARATEITENGTYDTTENNSVTVNVSGGGGGGATILSGAKEPTSDIGSNGDIYLRTLGILQPLVESQSALSINVTANSNWSGYDPWKAFSSVNNNWWIGNGGNLHWLQVEFQEQINLQEVSFITYDARRTYPISRIAYSDNGVDFTDAILSESTTDGLSGHASVSGECVGKYFRFIFDGSYGVSYYPGMGKLELFGASVNIYSSYCKVNGIWQNLIGTNINDINR